MTAWRHALFTPSTKPESGHDENISFAEGAKVVGEETMLWLQEKTLTLYRLARDYAVDRGIVLADTKFEIWGGGRQAEEPLLIDEILHPRQFPVLARRRMAAGRRAAEFRQAVRAQLPGDGGRRRPLGQESTPGPALPDDVIANTMSRYLEAYRRLTGSELFG